MKVSLVPGKEALSPVIQKVTEPYTKLLINYDRVLHDPAYNRGDGTGWGIDENMVYDRVLRHVGKEPNEKMCRWRRLRKNYERVELAFI